MSVDFAKKHATARGRLLELLSDLEWHLHRELRVAGVRYSARLLELKREGYQIDSEGNEDGKRYRLLSLDRLEPKTKMVKAFFNPDDVKGFLAGSPPAARFMKSLRWALTSFLKNEHKL